MDAWNVGFVARHQFGQLCRNRLFIGYFLFAWVATLWLQLTGQTELFARTLQQSPAFIPYLNAYLFAVFAVLPVVVLGNDAFCRSRRLDSLEAVYYRPESNAEYVAGVGLGFLWALGVVYAVFWVSALGLHVLFSEAPVSPGLYLYYPLTIVVPGLVFALGLTFLVSQAVGNRVLALLVLMAAFVLLVGYGGEAFGGVLDPLGLSLPAAWSEFTGLADAGGYLSQRGCWLLAGMGLLAWSVSAFRRLPNNAVGRMRTAVAVGCLAAGVLLGGLFVGRHEGRLSDRRLYKEVYKRYAAAPKATTVAHAIDYRQDGGRMSVVSELTLANGTGGVLKDVLLYLNPGLEVGSVREGDAELAFERDGQVVRVARRLEAGDTLRLRLEYGGGIDESVCHVNVPEERWGDMRQGSEMCMRYGKRYAYLGRRYTLLTPGALWYPTTLPPENPASVYDLPVDFTRFTLRVRNPERLTVISQGRRSGTPEDIRFRDEHPLSGISLCMGDYSTRRITVDSVTYEINLLRGHEYVLKPYYDSPHFAIRKAIRKARYIVEHEMGREYPFIRLMFAETPVHFASYYQPEGGASQYVLPELVLGGEWGRNWLSGATNVMDGDLDINKFLREDVGKPPFSWGTKFQRFNIKEIGRIRGDAYTSAVNPMLVRALFYDDVCYLRSERFPFVHTMMQTILRENNEMSAGGRRSYFGGSSFEEELLISYYLRERSFKDAFMDSRLSEELFALILSRESREFLNRLMVEGVLVDRVRDFTLVYFAEKPFRMVDFEDFTNAFRQRFGVDMEQVLMAQCERKGLPSYIVELLGEEVVPGDLEMRFCRFRVYNDSDVDGFIHVEKYVQNEDDSPYFWYQRSHDFEYEAYELKAHTGIEVRTRGYKTTSLHTNLAHNVPEKFFIPFSKYSEDTSQYVRPVAEEEFFPSKDEIVVDNEDESFLMNQPKLSLLERWRAEKEMPWEKYYTTIPNVAASRWAPLIGEDYYGVPVQSCVAKATGNGSTSVEWRAQLPQAGEYEVWVYVPNASILNRDQINFYSVGQEDWQETVELGNLRSKEWMLLGRFDCKGGECVVSLSDKGKEGQIVYGDAVKWVWVSE